MDREKEVMEYLEKIYEPYYWKRFIRPVATLIIPQILTRYELYDVEDEPRE